MRRAARLGAPVASARPCVAAGSPRRAAGSDPAGATRRVGVPRAFGTVDPGRCAGLVTRGARGAAVHIEADKVDCRSRIDASGARELWCSARGSRSRSGGRLERCRLSGYRQQVLVDCPDISCSIAMGWRCTVCTRIVGGAEEADLRMKRADQAFRPRLGAPELATVDEYCVNDINRAEAIHNIDRAEAIQEVGILPAIYPSQRCPHCSLSSHTR